MVVYICCVPNLPTIPETNIRIEAPVSQNGMPINVEVPVNKTTPHHEEHV